MFTTEKAREALDQVINAFESGDVTGAIVKTVISGEDLPAAKWSFLNRVHIALAGTGDARGIRQWNKVGRKIKPGTKAIYILIPCFRKETAVDEETGEERESMILQGFKAAPVFRVEDTEGKALPTYEPTTPPPLSDVAEEFGLTVRYTPFADKYFGSYNPDEGEIILCTHDEATFWHELAHAAHHRIIGTIQGGQNSLQETVAELTAAVLCKLYTGKVMKFSYHYIESYNKKSGAAKACMRALADVEKVLGLILQTAAEGKRQAA